MPKRFSLLCILLAQIFTSVAQLKSPEDFLGYKIGSKYTAHWKIVNYFQSVAAASPGMVKLQQYGETNEGRPLLTAFISSEANIRDLENIRKNNLRLAILQWTGLQQLHRKIMHPLLFG